MSSQSLDNEMVQIHLTEKRSMLYEMSGSMIMTQDVVTLDVQTIASNLIYASTIFNIAYIKKQAKEIDIESFMIRSSGMDNTDD